MAAAAGPPDWTVHEDGIRRSPSARHGTGTFATRNLPAGALVLVEAGLSAAKGYGGLLLHALLCPRLLASLSPAAAQIHDSLSERARVDEYATAAHLKLRANAFDVLLGELSAGGRAYFALDTLRTLTTTAVTSTLEQRDQLRAAVVAGEAASKHDFLAYKASMFNGATTLAEYNVSYVFTAGLPACICFVTRQAVACGEELLVDYGSGSNLACGGGVVAGAAACRALR